MQHMDEMKSRMRIAFADIDVLHSESMFLPNLGEFQDCYTGGEWPGIG